MSRRSEVFLTGKNLDLGTLMPRQLSKHFMAAPTAVYRDKHCSLNGTLEVSKNFWPRVATLLYSELLYEICSWSGMVRSSGMIYSRLTSSFPTNEARDALYINKLLSKKEPKLRHFWIQRLEDFRRTKRRVHFPRKSRSPNGLSVKCPHWTFRRKNVHRIR